MMMVRPLGSTFVVMRCSKLFKSWLRKAAAAETTIKPRKIAENREKGLYGIEPPKYAPPKGRLPERGERENSRICTLQSYCPQAGASMTEYVDRKRQPGSGGAKSENSRYNLMRWQRAQRRVPLWTWAGVRAHGTRIRSREAPARQCWTRRRSCARWKSGSGSWAA